MTEIWMLRDEDWCLPVEVTWLHQSDVACVNFVTALPMLAIQRAALATRLGLIGKLRDERWWVLRSVLESSAQLIVGDPEREIIWRPIEARVKFRSGEHNADRDEFFAEYARSGMINDPVKAEVIFVSFCKHMLSWMLNHQKPVSLGFADLYAVPYRPNWKQLVFQRQQGKKTAANKAAFTRKELAASSVAKLIERGTGDELLDPKLLFWCQKDGHMYWSIEARPRSMWWRMVKALETAKKAKRHGGLYLEGIGDTMKRCLPQTLELYGAYLQQVALPFVKLATSVRRRSGLFVPKASKKEMLGAPVLPMREPATHGDKEGESTVLDHVSSSAFLSTLSDIQRDRLEVRDTWSEMEQSKNRSA